MTATWAILSDIHGNRWALEAVLEDVARRGISRIVNLGDIFFGPLDPGGTADVLRRAGGFGWPTVRGNQDRALGEAAENPTLVFTLGELEPEDRSWASGLPLTLQLEDLYLCHGTPERDDHTLVEGVTPQGVHLRPEADLEELLSGIDAALVLCGHSHVPRLVQAGSGGSRRVLNPGSVGLPAYTAPAPHPHTMEAGTPDARYAVLRREDGGWVVEHIAVPYDDHAAIRAAERHGRPDWAAWLATGRGVSPAAA
jgi:predicted phosphodiesterase